MVVSPRPRQKWEYDDGADVSLLAASYAFGFSRNRPYRDGNKRIAFLTLVTFLGVNDYDFDTTDEDVVKTMLAPADGGLTETELADWVRARIKRQK